MNQTIHRNSRTATPFYISVPSSHVFGKKFIVHHTLENLSIFHSLSLSHPFFRSVFGHLPSSKFSICHLFMNKWFLIKIQAFLFCFLFLLCVSLISRNGYHRMLLIFGSDCIFSSTLYFFKNYPLFSASSLPLKLNPSLLFWCSVLTECFKTNQFSFPSFCSLLNSFCNWKKCKRIKTNFFCSPFFVMLCDFIMKLLCTCVLSNVLCIGSYIMSYDCEFLI